MKEWHRDPLVYREVYTRTVSALIAAFVIYLVAVFAGLADGGPAVVIWGLIFVIGMVVLILTVPGVIKHWQEVRPLFVWWNESPDPIKVHARRLYTRLLLGLFTTLAGAVFLWALFAQN